MSVAMESVSSFYQSSSGTDIEAIASRGQLPKIFVRIDLGVWKAILTAEDPARSRFSKGDLLDQMTDQFQIANGVQNGSKSSDSDSTNKPIRRKRFVLTSIVPRPILSFQ